VRRASARPGNVRIVAVICGIVEHKRHSSLKHGGFSWPLGRVKLDNSELVGYTPLLFGLGRIRVRYDEIEDAEVTRGRRPVRTRSGGTIRLRMRGGHRGDVFITTVGDGYEDIARALTQHDVPIREIARA
jgi:hypothetical protein